MKRINVDANIRNKYPITTGNYFISIKYHY